MRAGLRRWVGRARFAARRWLSSYPRLFLWLYRRWPRYRHAVVRTHTEIVIEGYPRCANSFSLRAFRLANPGVAVAHHMHAWPQVWAAIRRGLPCIVLIREPEAAVRSLLVRHPDISPTAALRSYAAFYAPLQGQTDNVVLAEFAQVIEDFGAILVRVNARFGTAFQPFLHSTESIAEVFAQLEQINRRAGQGETNPHTIPRPAPEREAPAMDVSFAGAEGLLAQVRGIYHSLLREAGSA